MTEIFRAVSERVVFIGEGRITEENTSASFFENLQHERSKDFLGQILQHWD